MVLLLAAELGCSGAVAGWPVGEAVGLDVTDVAVVVAVDVAVVVVVVVEAELVLLVYEGAWKWHG